MKKQMIRLSVHTLFAGLFFLTTVMATAASDTTQAMVNYKGYHNNLLAFDLNYHNPDQDRYFLMLTDDEGNVLYSRRFNKSLSNKRIYINKPYGHFTLSFHIRKNRETLTEKFEVYSQTRVKEERLITRL